MKGTAQHSTRRWAFVQLLAGGLYLRAHGKVPRWRAQVLRSSGNLRLLPLFSMS